MREPKNILVVQTAFLGDVILTLPLVQVLKQHFPSSTIDFLLNPRASELLAGHPAIHSTIIFDKRGKDAGIRGLLRMASLVRRNGYDIAFVPHRSLRSALLVALGGVKERVGFHRSAGRIFFNHIVGYEHHIHEVERNLRLLRIFGIELTRKEFPSLYPSDTDRELVDRFTGALHSRDEGRFIAIAPGTVWNTKRWLKERFAELSGRLISDAWEVFLLGGKEDVDLCREVAGRDSSSKLHVVAGELTLLQSAELIRRCRAIVCNDSAPMHLAVAMRTPIVALFGATIPEFGFAPYGASDVVIETKGLSCRPCSIHGGDECPVATFDCMKNISAEVVYRKVVEVIQQGLVTI